MNNNIINQTKGPYNLTIISHPKMVWFRIAKVGTRSLLELFQKSKFTFEIYEGRRMHFNSQKYKDHLKFCFVRNPYSRLVFGWQNKILLKKRFVNIDNVDLTNFKDFAKFICLKNLSKCDVHFRFQHQLIDLKNIDFIGRFERFEEDVKNIYNQVGVMAPISVPKKNISQRQKPIKDFYDSYTKRLVYESYRRDFELFDYKFNQM